MKSITHASQKKAWDKEHAKPTVLLQINSDGASYGIEHFIDWLKANGIDYTGFKGLDMCCGKGRNTVWLATQGFVMIGADFSEPAIQEANARASKAGVRDNVRFMVHDVTLPYEGLDSQIDIALDFYGSTDIENAMARKLAADNLSRSLKPGGFLATYLLSTDDAYNKAMVKEHQGPEPGSFIHPISGKFEKAFTEQEVIELHDTLKLLKLERIPKKFKDHTGKVFDSNYIWAVFQKAV